MPYACVDTTDVRVATPQLLSYRTRSTIYDTMIPVLAVCWELGVRRLGDDKLVVDGLPLS